MLLAITFLPVYQMQSQIINHADDEFILRNHFSYLDYFLVTPF